MKVAILGATGQLGRDLAEAFADLAPLALGHEQADVTSPASLARALDGFAPEVVINTAAFHDVDRIEEDPALALRVNVEGAASVARACRERGARLVHISTDYVFSGRLGRPCSEADPAEPVNLYGATKLAGEALVRALLPGALIVRTSALYGPHPCRGKGGRNFVDLMLKLGAERGQVRVVDDERTSPTWTPDLAAALRRAIESGASGTLHLAGGGSASWFEFARAIFETAGRKVQVEKALPGEFAKKAPRPANSALVSARLTALGLLPLRDWRPALAHHLRRKGLAG